MLHVEHPVAPSLHVVKLNSTPLVLLVEYDLRALPQVSGASCDGQKLNEQHRKPSRPASEKRKREQICNLMMSTCLTDASCTVDAICHRDGCL